MTEDISSFPPPEAEADDVLIAFGGALEAVLDDRTLLRQWAARFPALEEDLIDVSQAHAAGMSLEAPLETAPPDPEMIRLGREILDRHFARPPLSSLLEAGKARGLSPQQMASLLRMDIPLLSRLSQRLLDTAALPRTLVSRLADTLDRSVEEILAYLRRPGTLPVQAFYRAHAAPRLREDASAPRFADLLTGLSPEDRAYWQSEIEHGGTLGDE